MRKTGGEEAFLRVISGCAGCMGGLVKRIRKNKLNLSQLDFGNLCGISQRMISYMERMDNFHHFGMTHLFRIAYGIGVLPSDLLRYVESVMAVEEPSVMRPFFRNRRYYETMRKKWMDKVDANSARLFEALREMLVRFQSVNPGDISDEDMESIRRILEK